MKKNNRSKLPVTKQVAGGVAGAAIGAVVGGPIGAVVGGLAGAVAANRVVNHKLPFVGGKSKATVGAGKPKKAAAARQTPKSKKPASAAKVKPARSTVKSSRGR